VQDGVDVSSLQALRQMQRPGRPDGVARIVTSFLEESEARLDAMRQAAAAGDALALERAAHALKGISGTVGANHMHDLAMRLEHLGREGHTAGVADLLTELEAAFRRARPIFDRLRDAV
jgi:HPt (histidine-containing phosphotransfer) domain-containing protein